jgi:hypothetical protein
MSYVDQSDLEDVAGAAEVARLFCSDGSGVADPHLIASACQRASALFDSYVAQGWTDPAARRKLINDDPFLVDRISWVAMHLRAQAKTEWRDANGVAPFHTEYSDACGHFDRLAKGKARSKGEERAGSSVMSRGRVNRPTPAFVFAASREDPKGPGGF